MSSYGLTGFLLKRSVTVEAALKMAVLTSMAGFAVFVGAALLCTSTGALVPGAVSALFSGLMVNLGVISLVRCCIQVLPSTGHRMIGLLTGLGLVGALAGFASGRTQACGSACSGWLVLRRAGHR